MKYLIGVDFGGSSTKASVISASGEFIASSMREYPTSYPRNGWVEQCPEDSWNAFVDNIRALLDSSGVDAGDVEAIAFSAASQTGVYLDEHDNVVRASIYWTDKRALEQVAWLRENYGQYITDTCHNPPALSRTLVHLMWIRDNEPESFRRIRKVMFVKDYIRYRLTGEYVTDYVDAMGSLLMDVPRNKWSETLCALAGIRPQDLPEIRNPTDTAGTILPEMARLTGLSPKTKVVVGSTDTVLEVYANGAVSVGDMTIKLATAGRICPVTDRCIPHPKLVNYKHVVPGLWYPGTGMMSCAASYRWYRDVLSRGEIEEARRTGTDAYALLDEAASAVPIGSDGLLFLPYLQGEYGDPSLCASFTGICSYHGKGHFSRALLEGVAYGMKEHFDVIRSLGVTVQTPVIIGGGAKSPLWRQIMADVLNVRLSYNENSDSSLGAAMLAGVAAGQFASFGDSVKKCVRVKGYTEPVPENAEKYNEGFRYYKATAAAMKSVYHAFTADR